MGTARLTGREPAREVRRLIVGGLLAFVACAVAFLAIGQVVRLPGIPDLDIRATTLLHGYASPSLDGVMSAATGLGSTPVLLAVAVLSAGLLVTRHWASALFIVIALVCSLVMNDLLKSLYQRPRPTWDWAEAVTEYSFPSGHAMNATVTYVAIAAAVWLLWGRRAGGVALVIAVVVVFVVGVSRVYLGVHWLTDVIGGYLTGTMWLLVAAAATFAISRVVR